MDMTRYDMLQRKQNVATGWKNYFLKSRDYVENNIKGNIFQFTFDASSYILPEYILFGK